MQKVLFAVILTTLAGVAFAGPAPTAVVKAGDLEIAIEVKGRIGPGRVARVELTPLVWRGQYRVVSAVEPGSRVAEGEVVLRFDDKELREGLEKARFDMEVAQREMDALRERQAIAERASRIGVEAKERELHDAELASERYHEYTLPQAEKRATHDEEGYKRSVENAKEELDQLLKMYEEDELVDDTEEIVLKRARWDLLSRKRRYGYWQFGRLLRLKYDNPAAERSHRWNLMLKRIALDKARREAEMAEVGRRTEMERAERAMERRARELEELEADLAAAVVRAPRSGILLHGKADTGIGKVYSPGDSVGARSVVVSIADPDDLRVHLEIDEAETLRLEAGQQVYLKAGAVGAKEIRGVVERRDILPRDGTIKTRVKADGGISAGLLGIPVRGRVLCQVINGVLLLPLAAVERHGDSTRVYTVGPGGARQPVDVVVGENNGKEIIIESGLHEGDEVLLPEGGN